MHLNSGNELELPARKIRKEKAAIVCFPTHNEFHGQKKKLAGNAQTAAWIAL